MNLRHRMTPGLLVLVLLCLALPLPSQARQNLLLLGDSLGAGRGVPLEERWSQLLQQRLDHRNPGQWQVINASISGETTDGGLRRLPDLLQKYRPDIVLLELGGNDGLRGFPLNVTRDNLAGMIRKAQKTRARVVLIGIRLPPNYGPQYTKAFSNIYANLANQYQVPLVPFLLSKVYDQPGMMQEDGIHPTAKAQPQLLDNVWKILGPVIATTGSHPSSDKASRN